MGNVNVSRSVVIGVVAVAAASLLALAFVLGRESRPAVTPPTTRIERVAPRVQGVPLPASTPLVIAERPEIRPGGVTQLAASQAPPAIAGGREDAGSDPMRAAVASYFDAVDHIQQGAMSGDADGIAHEMAAALANGDTSGLDKMIRQTEAAKASLAVITPPAPCAAFHRESLASLDAGIEVLRSLKAAMESSEPVAQLANVSARATELRSRAEALQKEEAALRERYGLKGLKP